VGKLVKNELERDSFMSEPLLPPNYAVFSTPDELVESLASLTPAGRAKLLASCEAAGFTNPELALDGLEPLARARAGGKSLYLCFHVP